MRKVAFSLILVISFTFFYNYLPVSATSATLPSEFVNFEDLIGFQDIGYALIGGAEFDFTDSKYVIEDYSALSAAGKLEAERQKIKEFLQDYETSRGIGYSYNEGALYQGQSYYTTAFTQNANQIQEQYSISSENVDWAMGISPYKFADWAQYNRYWINRYTDSFTDSDSQPIVPDPPADYVTLIGLANSLQNGYGFFWANYPQVMYWVYNSDYSITFADNFLNHSWYRYSTFFEAFPDYAYNSQFTYPSSTILTLNINSVDDYYIGNISGIDYFLCATRWNTVTDQPSDSLVYGYSFTNSNSLADTTQTIPNLSSSLTYQDSSLYNVLNYFVHRFRNINIYVDGDPWAIVSNPAPANPIIPDFPDVIQNENNLAYDIPFPNTPTYEGTFDITSLFDALRQAIIDASDSDSSTVGTLTGEDVVSTYDGVDIDTQDRVVDLTSTKVFAGTLEDTTTDRLPDIPVPPIGVHNGLAGATVLAKYIDATQCILPEELITVFWGGFFILIILGLIKSLHR